MKIVQNTKGPVPQSIVARTREEFLATGSASLTGDDLYWALYRAAVESQGSFSAFSQQVGQLLDSKLGSGSYELVLTIVQDGHNGQIAVTNSRLPNSLLWAGDAGVLPGIGQNNAVACVVFWG